MIIKKLYNVRYQMSLGCGRDVWCIHGEYCGKTIIPSTPVSFDGESFKTASGSVYSIISYQQDPVKFKEQILSDINKKGYEIH